MQVGSVVKVATAIVALQYVDLDDEVLIDSTDLVDPAVYSNMGLIAGDTLTVEQLLMGLLVPSGGDAAEALARHAGSVVSGSIDPATARAAFVDAMNAWATRIGLQNTRFANASGADDASSFSSARDVSIMAAELIESPVLAGMVGMASYEFTSPGGNLYTGFNTNQMLGEGGVIGVKTGSTGNAGGCVVLARAEAGGRITILTILGSDLAYNELVQIVSDARWDDARAIFSTIDA
jgi:D-alanyl-D-alanine carboxypeptidase (penicillin-binding protein 5/6)